MHGHRLSLTSLSLLGLAGLVAAFQVLKGLSIEPHAYGLIPFLHTYADGALRRALLPSIFALAGINDPNSMAQMAVYLQLICLIGVASGIALIAATSQGLRSLLAWLMLASFILPGLAALTGYTDSFTALLLLASAYLLRRQKWWLAFIVLLIGLLQHEMMLALALPLLLAQALLQPQNRRALLAVGGGLILSAVFLMVAPVYVSALPASEACQLYRPVDGLQQQIWHEYCERLTGMQVSDDFNWLRLVLLPLFALTVGFLPLILLAAFISGATRMQTRLERTSLILMLALPYGPILFMWDADRLLLLAALSNWLVLDLCFSLTPAQVKRPYQLIAAGLVILQLGLAYPIVDHYGAGRVVSPAISDKWLLSARTPAIAWLDSMGAKPPESLIMCVDPRCQSNATSK